MRTHAPGLRCQHRRDGRGAGGGCAGSRLTDGGRRIRGASTTCIPAPTAEHIEAALDKLQRLLTDNDADAGDHLDALRERLEACGHPLAAALAPVARAIEEIDFDAAMVHLNTVRVAQMA